MSADGLDTSSHGYLLPLLALLMKWAWSKMPSLFRPAVPAQAQPSIMVNIGDNSQAVVIINSAVNASPEQGLVRRE